MQANMGKGDRILRFSGAVIIGIFSLAGELNGIFIVILGLIFLMLSITSIAGFCPLYVPLKISTKKKEVTAS